jgi:hypothetical protein
MWAWLARIVLSVFSLKNVLSFLFVSVLGVLLYNLGCDMIEEVLNFAVSKMSGQSISSVSNPTFTGFAGWMISQLKIPECVSVVVTCVSIRFVLSKIPFLHW